MSAAVSPAAYARLNRPAITVQISELPASEPFEYAKVVRTEGYPGVFTGLGQAAEVRLSQDTTARRAPASL